MNLDAADGAKFWISFKQPAILSSFSCLQVIQNKLLWCLAAAYVTAGYVHESFKPAQMYCDLIGWKMSKVQFVTNSYDGTTVQWKKSRCPGLWKISINFISEWKTVMWCLGGTIPSFPVLVLVSDQSEQMGMVGICPNPVFTENNPN